MCGFGSSCKVLKGQRCGFFQDGISELMFIDVILSSGDILNAKLKNLAKKKPLVAKCQS